MKVLAWDSSNLLSVASHLLAGEVVVMPSDTIYGTLGLAQNRLTVSHIYDLKERTPTKPVIILISSLKDLAIFGVKPTRYQRSLLNRFWPGTVSVILSCKGSKFEYLHRGTHTLAFRLPKDELLTDLIRSTGPLAAPSANPEGHPPAKNISEAKTYFRDKIALYVDGGNKEAPPSTLVSILDSKITVLRGTLP